MNVIEEIIGNYPLGKSDVAKRREIKNKLSKERKRLDEAWTPINQAVNIVVAKLKDCEAIHRLYCGTEERVKEELKRIYEREYSNIWEEINSDSLVSVNKEGLEGIVQMLESGNLSPILLTRKIKYGKLSESWSLGWDSDHGVDINTYNEFAYCLDLGLGKQQVRVGVQGEIIPIHKEPRLRVDYAHFYLLDNQSNGLTKIRAYNYYDFGVGIFALQTKFSANSFLNRMPVNLKGANLTNPYKSRDKTYPVNFQYAPLLSSIKKIIEFMNSQRGKVSDNLTEGSFVCYDRDGNPALSGGEK